MLERIKISLSGYPKLAAEGAIITKEMLHRRMLSAFVFADFDGDGSFGPLDQELAARISTAQIRSSMVTSKLRSYDLNIDGQISRSEVLEALGPVRSVKRRVLNGHVGDHGRIDLQTQEQIDGTLAREMQADLNKDGVIDWSELFKSALSRSQSFYERYEWRAVPESFDVNRDNIVSREEYVNVVDSAFDKLDADHSGIVSRKELVARFGDGLSRH